MRHGSNKISAWIALDDATVENGCLRFIPGSHRGLIEHARKDGPFANYLPEDRIDVANAVDAPMAAGDTCFFIDLAPHASYGNVSGRPPEYPSGSVTKIVTDSTTFLYLADI